MKGSGYVVANGHSFLVGSEVPKHLQPGEEIPQGAYAKDAMKVFLEKGQIVRKTQFAPLPEGADELEVQEGPRTMVTEQVERPRRRRRGKVLAAEGGEE